MSAFVLSLPRLRRQHSVLPGFGLALGFALVYLSLIVLIPLSAAFIKTTALGWSEFWATVTTPRVLASYRLTFGASLIAALINAPAPPETTAKVAEVAAATKPDSIAPSWFDAPTKVR